jgi:hypothetical protein
MMAREWLLSTVPSVTLSSGLCLQALSAKPLQGPPVLYYTLANSRGPYSGPGPRWGV